MKKLRLSTNIFVCRKSSKASQISLFTWSMLTKSTATMPRYSGDFFSYLSFCFVPRPRYRVPTALTLIVSWRYTLGVRSRWSMDPRTEWPSYARLMEADKLRYHSAQQCPGIRLWQRHDDQKKWSNDATSVLLSFEAIAGRKGRQKIGSGRTSNGKILTCRVRQNSKEK